jgi:hypothetical protein
MPFDFIAKPVGGPPHLYLSFTHSRPISNTRGSDGPSIMFSYGPFQGRFRKSNFLKKESSPAANLTRSQVSLLQPAEASRDSGKAEGFATGEWANHRQAALAAATRKYGIAGRNRYDTDSD